MQTNKISFYPEKREFLVVLSIILGLSIITISTIVILVSSDRVLLKIVILGNLLFWYIVMLKLYNRNNFNLITITNDYFISRKLIEITKIEFSQLETNFKVIAFPYEFNKILRVKELKLLLKDGSMKIIPLMGYSRENSNSIMELIKQRIREKSDLTNHEN